MAKVNKASNAAAVTNTQAPAINMAALATKMATRPAATIIASNAGKYAAAHNTSPHAIKQYKLTPLGVAMAANKGLCPKGKANVMACAVYALYLQGAHKAPVYGAAAILTMRTHSRILGLLGATRAAKGANAYANGLPTVAWCGGYVNGATLAKHGLATLA